MKMKLEYVVSFIRAVKALFTANKTALIAFDDQFDDPYETDVLDVKIAAAEAIIGTSGKIGQNEEDTKVRNKFMDNLIPILKELKYDVKKGIKGGSITNSLKSFGIGDFTGSIHDRSIGAFHTAYGVTYAQVTANHAALAVLGFNAAKVLSLKTNHDGAWGMEGTKIVLAKSINDLSNANRATVEDCLGEGQVLIDGLRAMAESTENANLKKQATFDAILRSVGGVPAHEVRNRIIPAGSSIVLFTDFTLKNILQLMLLTDVKVMVGLCELKTDEVVDGLVLTYLVEWEGKKKDLTGSGRYIKITNCDTHKKAVVSYFVVDVQLS